MSKEIDLSTLGKDEQAVLEQCRQKLRRTTTLVSWVEVEEAESLGAVSQYAAQALAEVHDTRPLSPQERLALPPEQRKVRRLILRCVEHTPLEALIALREQLG